MGKGKKIDDRFYETDYQGRRVGFFPFSFSCMKKTNSRFDIYNFVKSVSRELPKP